MLKNVSKINGIVLLGKSVQKSITGSFSDDYGQCHTPNSFFCGIPGHICCHGNCVLPNSPVCNNPF
ncbi:hypothetical protein [Aquimarina sp. RZ0]|uniref:hypothetical protein n=1 Tax=Aquimarina sp. RZ0 TaxID=2607730 RepID=UPI0011F2ADD2|nr:hypothetical protein [Aquimarina sp. RZ0]KAA1247457.1 hypothetical protein F0000_03080 [Aquimarina sp. RZ0]